MLLPDGTSWNQRLFDHVPGYLASSTLNRILTGFLASDVLSGARELVLKAPPFHASTTAFLAAHERFIANSLVYNGAKLYVDGSKIPRRVELLAQSDRIELSIIHLIRDGRGFCNSYRKNVPGATLQAAAHEWNAEIDKVDALARRLPRVKIHRVRYEDLCQDLLGAFAALCEFLGIPPDGEIVGGERGTFHVIGNRMRKTFTGVIKEDLSWKQELSPGDLATVESLTAGQLRRFGYM